MSDMSIIAFKVDEDGEVSLSNNASLDEDRQEAIDVGDDGTYVAHIEYQTDESGRAAAVDIILGCHDLEVGSRYDLSTLERLAAEIWKAGVDYGRNGHKMKASEI